MIDPETLKTLFEAGAPSPTLPPSVRAKGAVADSRQEGAIGMPTEPVKTTTQP